MADVKKAERQGRHDGIAFTLTVLLYVLADKFNANDEQLNEINRWFILNVSAIESGEIKYADMVKVLKEEYGWTVTLE